MSTMRNRVTAWAVGALWIPAAIAAGTAANTAANASDVTPGDEAMTCEQIYAAGTAETQRDQEERSQKKEQMRAQGSAFKGLAMGAMAVGGLFGTGQAVQAAAEAGADRQMAMMANTPQSNPRMEHLKQLWAQKHCAKK